MLVQPPRGTSTLILRELEIPTRTQPVLPSGEWGINRAAAWLVFPDKGLQIFLHPWSSMGKGDLVELLLNGNNVVDQLTIAKDADVGQRVTLFVAPRHLQTGSHTLTYRVTRLNQGAETQTPPTRIYVKIEVPGGQDIDPEPGHSNLFMYIPAEVVIGGVDKDIAEAGVPIVIRAPSGNGAPYPAASVGDVITLSWGGILLASPPLTAGQINDPANHPITFVVGKSTIEEAGDTDYAGLAVTFLVTDIVGNQSEDWCTETRITVSVGTVSLTAPIAKDAFNNKIDLDQLGNKDLTIQVWASPPSFKFGDIIHLKMRGTSVDGETIEVDAPTQTIDNLPHSYELLLNNADARRLVKTQVIFSYTLARSGSTEPLRSKNQFVQIEGEADRLSAPIAEDAQQGAINPDLPAPRIRIPYDPLIQVGMAIELSWVGTRPDGSTYDPELEWYFPSKSEADNPQGFTITVEGTHLKTLEGGKLVLSYALLSEKENGDILRRESHKAAQLNVGDPLLELVAPQVLGEKDGALEPNDLPNGTSQLTAPKSAVNPTRPQDVVTYTWIGELSGETEDEITLNSLSAGKDVPFPLDAKFVAKHIEPNRGKKITVSYRIWRAETGTSSYSNALVFTVGLELATPVINSVEDSKGFPIPQNSHTVDPNVKVGGTATRNLSILIFNNGVSTGSFTTADDQGNWSRGDLTGLSLGDCNLTAVAQYGSEPVSAVWKIIIASVETPTITLIKDSKGVEIPHGGVTTDTSLWLTGTASRGQKVDVLSGVVSKGIATANPLTGIWELAVSELSIAAYSFIAKAEYGEGPVSAARDVVIAPTEALEDFETVNLGQFNRLDLPMFHIYTSFQGVQIQAITDAPYITGKAVRIPWLQGIECTLKISARKVRFGYKLLDEMEIKYAFYDEDDVRTFGFITPKKNHADWFEFSYGDARRIKKITIYTDKYLIQNAGFVDNITLWY